MISGMGELHLEVIVDRMKREFNVEAGVGRPQVAYRETVRGDGQEGRGQVRPPDRRLGPVRRRLHRPRAGARRGLRLREQDQGRLRPSEFIPAVEKGIEEALETGVKAGYPMVDVRVTLTDGKYHDTDSSEIAFKVAGSLAAQGGRQARQAGAARADHGRRGRRPRTSSWATSSATSRAGAAASRARSRAATPIAVQASVPLSEMFGYATDLRSNTQGRANYSMQFDRYEEVPNNIAEEIVEHRTGEPVGASA